MRAVIDTGVLVSGLIRGQGPPGDVLRALVDKRFTAIYTAEMLMEIVDVLGRPKFRVKYHIEANDIAALIHMIRLRGTPVVPSRVIELCRDPKDDKFLTAAVAGQANCIVSGDADLLALSPFEAIVILTPKAFSTVLSG